MGLRWHYGNDGVAVFPDEAHYDRFLGRTEERHRHRLKILCELHRRDLKREHSEGWRDITPAGAARIAKGIPEGEMPQPEPDVPSSGDWLERVTYTGKKIRVRSRASAL